MNPVGHFLAGWAVANLGQTSRRERVVITVAGVLPDVDGLGLIAQHLTHGTEHKVFWYDDYHHVLGHNVGLAALAAVGAFLLTKRSWRVTALVLLSFHVHLLLDVMGSKGLDGYQWPIPYLLPFSDAWQWAWSGQWLLGGWQNKVIAIGLYWLMFVLAWKRGFSPFEMVSPRADRAFVSLLRRCIPWKGAGPTDA